MNVVPAASKGRRKKCAAPWPRCPAPSLGCDPHPYAHARHSRTGPATTDGMCCVLCRAFVLVGNAYDTSDTVILTSI